MALYLLNQALPALVQDLKQPDLERHTDFSSLSDIFHIHGVNMRYLGTVCGMIHPNEYPGVRLTLERTILVKGLKHVFRCAIRETSQLYLADTIAHLLNCIFGVVQEKSEEVVVDKKKKKKKRVQESPKVNKSFVRPVENAYLSETP